MSKKYVVRLTEKERRIVREVITKLNGSSQKVRRAQMLLKADASGPAWTDERIAEAFDSRTRTVEKLRERFVSEGFEQVLHGKQRERPPTERLLSGTAGGSSNCPAVDPASQGICQLESTALGESRRRTRDCRLDKP